MDNSKQIFTGKSGKLIVGRNGVTIERNFAQANQERSKRVTQIEFSEIESLRHRYAADKPGYIEIKAKAGGSAGSGFNRRQRIHFDASSSHRFRRAQKQIARKIQEQAAESSSSSSQANSETATSPSPIHNSPRITDVNTAHLSEVSSKSTSYTADPPQPPPTLSIDVEATNHGLPFRGFGTE